MGTNNGNGYNGRFTAEQVADALRESEGYISYAARRLGCCARTVTRYIKKHPTVARARYEAQELLKDDAESKLQKHIKEGNVTALIFFLKCQAKDRGYTERYQVDSKIEVETKRAKISDDEILEEAKEIINFREANAFSSDQQ